MLFWFPTLIWVVLSHLWFYKVAELVCSDPFLAALQLYCVTKIEWSSSGGQEDFVSFYFAPGTLQGYPAEKIAP